MRRVVEWVLASIAAVLCIAGVMQVAGTQVQMDASLWPMPGLVLLESVLLGLAGFAGIALDDERFGGQWGRLTWVVCGAMLAMGLVGIMTVSAVGLLVLPAVIFGAAALLADTRRNRRTLSDLGILTAGGVVNLAVLSILIMLRR